jgi:hypothetical protein
MRTLKTNKNLVGLMVLAFVLGACKGESPTAPPTGGGNPPGGQTPPVNVVLTLTSSNAEPLVDSTTVITASATLNGQPVPNGTAVEFVATGGVFLDTETSATIRTTTNGVATATLTSSTPGTVRVTATVNNVTRSVDVTFLEQEEEEPEPSTQPTISGVAPAIGIPGGGERVVITGTNFKAPVRVLFDTGGPVPLEGFVVSVSDTRIEVVTPSVNLGAGQQLEADIIVINNAGSSGETRVVRTDGFIFRREQLTPVISALSPSSGPVTGGTRVTIFGEGFQAPVQVSFGSAAVPAWQEAQVVDVQYSQIIVLAPDARSTAPAGSGTVTGPVDVRVVNIFSNTNAVATNGYRYTAAMQITNIAPSQGTISGGTNVVIDGIGFVAPVAVTIAGIPAQPIEVTGTRVIARTAAPLLNSCGGISGPVVVTNVVNGDQAAGPTFNYVMPIPVVVSVDPAEISEGGSVEVVVANALEGLTRIKIGDRTAVITDQDIDEDGIGTFMVTVPMNFDFETEACTEGGIAGEREIPLTVDVIYQHVQTSCTDTAQDALTIEPPSDDCVLPPEAELTQTLPVPPTCADAGSVDDASGTATATITFRNDGGQPLTITRTSITGTNAADFTVSPSGIIVEPQQSGSFTVTFDPSAVGSRTATVNFNTNDADEGTVSVCLEGTGT